MALKVIITFSLFLITKGAHQKIIDKFSNHEYDILVGTQMIAKGLDFPLVTLVGAVVSEVLGLAVYAAKSVKENTSGGIIYETAMKEQEIEHETVG